MSNDDIVVGPCTGYREGGNATIYLSDLLPEARALLEVALEDAGKTTYETRLLGAARAFAMSASVRKR